MDEKDYREEQIARLTRRIQKAKALLADLADLPSHRIQAALRALTGGEEGGVAFFTFSSADAFATAPEPVRLAQVSRAVMDSIEEAMSEPSAERARILIDSARIYADLANALAIARGDEA